MIELSIITQVVGEGEKITITAEGDKHGIDLFKTFCVVLKGILNYAEKSRSKRKR